MLNSLENGGHLNIMNIKALESFTIKNLTRIILEVWIKPSHRFDLAKGINCINLRFFQDFLLLFLN